MTESRYDHLAPPELGLEFEPPEALPQRIPVADPLPRAHPTVDAFKTLASFWYWRTVDIDATLASMPDGGQIIADCGAFSAHRKGVDISVDDYCAWITKWCDRLTAYSSMDVIGDPVTSAMNLAAMERRGFSPVPVFHFGEDMRYFEAYCDQYPYVLLGGMVGAKQFEFLVTWVAKCFRIAERNGNALHGFGRTHPKLLDLFPWFSVDSSGWVEGWRFGHLNLFDGTLEFQHSEFDEAERHADLIRAHGVDPDAFKPENYHHTSAVKVNAYAWWQLGQFLRERHGPVTLDGYPDGLHLYLVGAGRGEITVAAQHIHDMTKGAHT